MKSARSKAITLHSSIIVLIFALLLSSCSEEEDTLSDPGGSISGPIEVESIILNPKSPAPFDTIRVTAVVTSEEGTNVGDFASYQWSATGGTFLESDKTSVRWVAPNTSAMFSISVTASNSTNSDSGSENVFVGELIPFVDRDAGEVHPDANGDVVHYLSAARVPGQGGFNGFGIRVNEMGNDREIIGVDRSFQQHFNSDHTAAVQVVGPLGGLRALEIVDLQTGLTSNIVEPPELPLNRTPQLTEPFYSPDGKLITYQGFLPDQFGTPAQGGVDTFVVFSYDVASQKAIRVTAQVTNFHPTFSNDGKYLVYVADRTNPLEWELYGLPVAADTVAHDTIGVPIKLTDTGGLMGSDEEIPDDLLKAWSPNSAEPLLAITDSDGKLRIVPTIGNGGYLVSIAGTVDDFAWAPAGGVLAATNGQTIYKVTPPNTVDQLHTVESGDRVDRLSWDPNGKFIIFAVIRLRQMWFELYDVDGSLGITKPLKITPATEQGDADVFEEFYSTRPVWLSVEPTGYFLFFDQTTPRISTMSISGLIP